MLHTRKLQINVYCIHRITSNVRTDNFLDFRFDNRSIYSNTKTNNTRLVLLKANVLLCSP